jgi:NAD(P)-dependent dehydrogenase (short-subunit alcohol dehydrogenase family)
MQLQGKTALITGATSGIGRATAKQFLDEGAARVFVTGQDTGRLESMRADLDAGDSRMTALRWRAEEIEDAEAVRADIERDRAKLDVVFLNAGVTWPAPFGQIDPVEAQRQFMVNVTAPLTLLQTLSPVIADGASVVMTTSCLDVMGKEGMAVYSASKAALRSLARTLSAELRDRRIRVNTVAPGPIQTPIYGKLGLPEGDLDAMTAAMIDLVPVKRWGQPDEIAKVALFLASDASSFMLGEEVTADGGWSNL